MTAGASGVAGESPRNKGHHYSFGTSGREVLSKQKAPGPQAYSVRSNFAKKGSGFSMGGHKKDGKAEDKEPPRIRPLAREETPGPGSHDITSTVGQGGKCAVFGAGKTPEKIVEAERKRQDFKEALEEKWALKNDLDEKKNENPKPHICKMMEDRRIPGDHDVNMEARFTRAPRCCFGTPTAPNSSNLTSFTPGPGTYTPGEYDEAPRFTMKAKYIAPKQQETPGPGAFGGHYSAIGDYRPSVPKSARGPPMGATATDVTTR